MTTIDLSKVLALISDAQKNPGKVAAQIATSAPVINTTMATLGAQLGRQFKKQMRGRKFSRPQLATAARCFIDAFAREAGIDVEFTREGGEP